MQAHSSDGPASLKETFFMKRSKIYPGYFILPALLLIALLYLLPALLGTAYSFTDWNRYSNELHFVGWKNYIKVFSGGEKYIGYIKNTVFFTVLSAVFGKKSCAKTFSFFLVLSLSELPIVFFLFIHMGLFFTFFLSFFFY